MTYEQFVWWLSGYIALESGTLSQSIKDEMNKIDGFFSKEASSPVKITTGTTLEGSIIDGDMEEYFNSLPLEDENLASVGDLIETEDLDWRPSHGKA